MTPPAADGADARIAVVGMACRVPGASTIEAFWRNLVDGVESITVLSGAELRESGVPAALADHPRYVRAGAFIEDTDRFDASVFGLTPRDATLMDPQHRLLLECAWEALERAGHTPGDRDAVGVYVGVANSGYLQQHVYPTVDMTDPAAVYQAMISGDRDFVATRMSYLLGLTGPSVNVQTACSTSLVAVHMACQALLAGECDMAIAGGAALRVPQRVGYVYEDGLILSPDGHCRAFDAAAAGTVVGNGAGVVVLKRLGDALAEGDRVHAVVLGSAVNNDGARKAGYTAPSVAGQVGVIVEAQALAGVDPDTIGYVEAHGTGTPLGDPIEVTALTDAFRRRTRHVGFCALGSVKTNVGHLDTAAGVVGLIKAVLAVEHATIPPTLHFQRPNPELRLPTSPFEVNGVLRPWQVGAGRRRRAGVSSFGIGGTNAHVLIEEAPPRPPSGAARPWQVLVVSARTSTALMAASERLAEHLERRPGDDLADVAYTLACGRRTLPHRRAVVARTVDDAVARLREHGPSVASHHGVAGERRATWMFPGQGAQRVGMGRALYASEEAFRNAVDECATLFEDELGSDIRQLLYPAADGERAADEALAATAHAQAALFAVEYGLARLWTAWGVEPDAVIGHSVGEYVAACVAGALSLEDAVALVAARGRLMPRLPAGAMLAEPALDAFRERVEKVALRAPTIAWVSGVTGRWMTPAEATDPEYWVRQLREPVRFGDGVRTLQDDPERALLEVGPGDTLTALARLQCREAFVVTPSLGSRRQEADESAMAHALGTLWEAGIPVDWHGYYRRQRRCRVLLPTYPFERQRYWIDRADAVASPEPPTPRTQGGPSPRAPLERWLSVPSWKRSVPPQGGPTARRQRWLLFVDAIGVGRQLAHRLQLAGEDVVQVEAGDAFRHLGDGRYTIDPARPDDYPTLLDAVGLAGAAPRIAHLWSVTGTTETTSAARRTRSYASLVSLGQALARLEGRGPVSLTVVSDGLHDVTGDERLCPDTAMLLGPVLVLPQEHPEIHCRSVDVEPDRVDDDLVDRLLDECRDEGGARIVAYRGRHRWVQIFESLPAPPDGAPVSGVRRGGVYLITGGLGAVGLTLARHFHRTAGARLVLTTRSPLPPHHRWKSQAPGADARLARRLATLLELEAAGAEVLVRSVDVADIAAMREVVREAEARFGRLDGVIHAAGAPAAEAFTPVEELDADASERHVRPKVLGVQVLRDVLGDRDLQFCVLMSSLASVLGGLGFTAYAAANAYMDAFAQQQRRERGAPWLSVSWDAWRIEPAPGMPAAMGADLRGAGIQDAEGAEVLDRLLTSRRTGHVVVSTSDVTARLAQWTESGAARLASAPEKPGHAGTDGSPRSETERVVLEVWQRLLGVDAIGIHDDFYALGGDSLLATQVLSRLRRAFDVELSVRLMFEAATVASLAARIDERVALRGDDGHVRIEL